MICAYKLVKSLIKFIDEKENKVKKSEPMKFFLKSMSDETYLDMIREQIEFLIDEGYKYSEQLEIINTESAKNIKYSTYTNFVKLFILEKPENIFQNREFHRFYSNYQGKDNLENSQKSKDNSWIQEDIKVKESTLDDEVSNINISPTKEVQDYSIKKMSVAPLKKKVINSSYRAKVGFQHEAMPDVNELY